MARGRRRRGRLVPEDRVPAGVVSAERVGVHPRPDTDGTFASVHRLACGLDQDGRSPGWTAGQLRSIEPVGRWVGWRRRRDLNAGWRFCRPLPYHLATAPSGMPERREGKMERETGFEPATSTLARSHSTTELFPPKRLPYHSPSRRSSWRARRPPRGARGGSLTP